MNDRFLEIDIRLLVLRYGRQKVLRALAQLGEQTFDELEQQLRAVKQKSKVKRRAPSVMELVSSECSKRPDIAEPLRALAIRFENRTFLPHLRDLRRFLDPDGSSSRKLRSRSAAVPKLIRTLAKLTREDLLRLATEDKSAGEDDYAILARAIMGRPDKDVPDID